MQVKKQQAQSHAKMHTHTHTHTHKSSQTPPYTQERSKAQYKEPEDTVIAKGTDKVNGTGTGNGLAQRR